MEAPILESDTSTHVCLHRVFSIILIIDDFLNIELLSHSTHQTAAQWSRTSISNYTLYVIIVCCAEFADLNVVA